MRPVHFLAASTIAIPNRIIGSMSYAHAISDAVPEARLQDGRRVIEHWRVFGPGFWKGERFTRDCIAEMVKNYHRFVNPIYGLSTGPFYTPTCSINHDDDTAGLVDGIVIDAGQDPDGWLWVSIALDSLVAWAIDQRKLRSASIEYWDTNRWDDMRLSGFPLVNGKPAGRILSRVSLMGAVPPAVKGQPLPPLSRAATSADRRFSNAPTHFFTTRITPMNLKDLVEKFRSVVPGLTDDEYMALAQSATGDPSAGVPNMDAATGAMMDASGMGGMDAMPSMPDPMDKKPDAMLGDPRFLRAVTQAFNKLQAEKEAKDLQNATAAEVKKFCDAIRDSKKNLAEADRLQRELLALTPTARLLQLQALQRTPLKPPTPADRKFSDGTATGSKSDGPSEAYLRTALQTPQGRATLQKKYPHLNITV
jgi:hypothetical protein